MKRWLGVLLVAAMLSACSAASSPAASPSDPDPGFTGSSAAPSLKATSSALLRPTHGALTGVARFYGGPATSDGTMALDGAPAGGIRVNVSRDGNVVAAMVTRQDGRFSFVLPPGRYVVSGCSSFTIVVRAGGQSSHDLTCPVP